MKRSILACALLAACGFAQADNRQGWYAGAGGTFINSGVSSGDGGSISFTAAEILGGYKYNPYVGGELRIGLGFSGDDRSIDGETYEFGINHYESLYYRIETANQTAKLYGLLGFSNISIEADDGMNSSSASDSGLSWGAGVGFALDPRSNLNFEYRNIISNDDNDFYAFGINYDFRF